MRFNTDHYFHIGKPHVTAGVPCQDYALSIDQEDSALAIVSDGCSTGRHTDVGSRLVTLAFKQAIADTKRFRPDTVFDHLSHELRARFDVNIAQTKTLLGLHQDDLLATCVYAHASMQKLIAHIVGDGVIAVKYLSGDIELFRFDWDDNTPYYPCYTNGSVDKFIEVHGGDLAGERLTVEHWRGVSEEWEQQETDRHSLLAGMRGLTVEREPDNILCVAVFSDGVTQIQGIDWKDAVHQFLAFKNTTGVFLKRRMARAIRDIEKEGGMLLDDIAGAAIHLEQNEETIHDDDQESNSRPS